MPDYELRQLNENDYQAIYENIRAIALEPETTWDDDYPNEELIREDIKSAGALGLFENGVLTAFGTLSLEPGIDEQDAWSKAQNCCYIERVGVRAERRGKGLAHIIVNNLCEKAMSEGHDWVRLIAYVNNAPAIKVYEGVGFRRVKQVRFFDIDWYMYEKPLI